MPAKSIVRPACGAEGESPPRPAAQADPRRVLEDVVDQGLDVALLLDDAALEPVLEQVPAPVVAPVEPARVDPVQTLHSGRQSGLRGVDEQVEVVVEQVPRHQPPAEPALDVGQQLEPALAVAVV
jgi:hypothetical protein